MQDYSYLIGALGLVLTVFNIIDKISQFKAKLDKPEMQQNERIQACEDKLISHEAQIEKLSRSLDDKGKQIKTMQDTNRIFVKSLLALLSNNQTEKEEMYNNLHDYLVNHMDNSMY